MIKISIFSFLFSVSALAISLFQYEHVLRIQPTIEMQLQKEAKQLQEINAEIMQLKEKLQAQQGISMQTPPVTLTTPPHFALNEIANLIHLSTLQLEHAHDPKAANRILMLADKKIEALHDTRFARLREAIMTERLALEAIQLPDTEGIWLQLGALITETEQFPSRWTLLNKDTVKKDSESKQSSTFNSSTSHWQKAWKQGWNELKDLIKIQRHDKAIEPLLSAKEQTLARQHIQLLLEQARLAILNVKPMVYKTSLQEAQQWLIRDFDNNDRGVKNAINTLNDLEQINLTVVLPHLDQTLNQLDQLEKKALSDKTQP